MTPRRMRSSFSSPRQRVIQPGWPSRFLPKWPPRTPSVLTNWRMVNLSLEPFRTVPSTSIHCCGTTSFACRSGSSAARLRICNNRTASTASVVSSKWRNFCCGWVFDFHQERMTMRVAPQVVLTEEEQRRLLKYSRGRSTPARLVLRAKIVLLAAQGC